MPTNGASPVPSFTFPAAPPASASSVAHESWQGADIAAAFASGLALPPTTLLERKDGFPLFYSGKLNSLIGESESGKTWVALLAVVQEIKKSHKVIFIDYEDSLIAVLVRLVNMGLTQVELSNYFMYIKPEVAITDADKALLEQPARESTLVVIDGVTEVMSIENLDSNAMEQVAKFYKNIPKWFAQLGPGVVLIDHVTKSNDNRGTFAIGSQHKKAGIDGASYTVTKDWDFARGKHGRAYLKIAKDKNGAVRAKADKGEVGVFHLDSNAATGHCDAWIDLPNAPVSVPVAGGVRTMAMPASKITALIGYVKLNPGTSKADVHRHCGGRKEDVYAALGELVLQGYITNDGSDARPQLKFAREYGVPVPGLEDFE